jgi:acetoin utilization deacetylase AcuC-like enzyme
MTKDGIVERDAYVIDTCVDRRVPIVMLLGGGYSAEAWVVQHASVARTIEKYGVAPRRSGDEDGRSRDD